MTGVHERYMDHALIPSIMHIAPHDFIHYPDAVKAELRQHCLCLIAAGWAGNPRTIKND